jgi:hypothetical protein
MATPITRNEEAIKWLEGAISDCERWCKRYGIINSPSIDRLQELLSTEKLVNS